MIFANEPLLELRREAVRREALEALAALDAKLPLEVPMLIGEDVVTGRRVRLRRPLRADSRRRPRPRRHRRARRRRRRLRRTGFAEWNAGPAAERAAVLRGAARRCCATAGSSSRRSRSARQASRGPRPTPTSARRSTSSRTTPTAQRSSGAGRALLQLPGERNALRYSGRGVVAVIAPVELPPGDRRGGWCRAALATGNAVVLKPAEQTPACAKAVVDALHAAGVPHAALCAAARWRRAGQGARRPPRRPCDRLHRLLRGGPAHPRDRGEGPPRPAPHQEGRRRDGRQERDHRRRRRRPRRRGAGDRHERVRLRRPEVLGGVTRARPRAGRRCARAAPARGPSRPCRSGRRRTSRPTCLP